MTVSSKTYDLSGNQNVVDGITIAYDAMTNVAIPVSTRPSVTAGTGDPTFSAPKGTLYVRLDGSGVANRLWINTNGTTGWTNFTSAA